MIVCKCGIDFGNDKEWCEKYKVRFTDDVTDILPNESWGCSAVAYHKDGSLDEESTFCKARISEKNGLCRIAELDGKVNRPEEYMVNNVKTNIKRILPQVQPHLENDANVALCCGGPSLRKDLKKLRILYKEGYKVVSVNNTHDWLIERDIIPSAHIQLDSRPENAEFLNDPIDTCKYFLASQCHPDCFDKLKDTENVFIYHVESDTDAVKDVLDEYYRKNYIFIEGGTTVTLRGIMLLRVLGFQLFDIFGFDSCWMDDKHHSYDQELNDKDGKHKVMCAGKEFYCAPWMVKQAQDFMKLIKYRGDLFKCQVHGDGLIAHMLKTGANLDEEEK